MRLDGEAKHGRQAVDLNAFDANAGWEGKEEEKPEQDNESLNAVGSTKCYICGKKGT